MLVFQYEKIIFHDKCIRTEIPCFVIECINMTLHLIFQEHFISAFNK